jgi:hypothetical protein
VTPEIKPGWQTTEFYFSLAVALWAALGHRLPVEAQTVIVAVVTAVYTIARTIAKRPIPPLPTLEIAPPTVTGAQSTQIRP